MKSVIVSFVIILSATFATQAQTNEIYAEVTKKEVMNKDVPVAERITRTAAFPGGLQELAAYLQKNLEYPTQARENAIEGKVRVVFEVTPTGKVKSATVLSGIGFGCDEEALRVVADMPNWLPALQAGYPVTTKVVVPLQFRLTL